MCWKVCPSSHSLFGYNNNNTQEENSTRTEAIHKFKQIQLLSHRDDNEELN